MIVAVTRAQIADYVSTLVWIYTILILVRILLTWVPSIPYHPALNAVVTFVEDVTDPYLGWWRRIIPTVNVGGAGLDLSPIAAIFVLSFVGSLLVSVIAG